MRARIPERWVATVVELLNRVLRPLRLQLVTSSSLAALRAATDRPPEPEVALPPADAREYLQPSNPRLLDLTRRYDGLPGSQTSRWSADYVGEVDLLRFRADNPYVWSTRDEYVVENGTSHRLATRAVNYALSAYYARSIDEAGVLERSADDGMFGNYRLRIDDRLIASRDLLDSTLEINFLERHCRISEKAEFKLLDIGAGYGRLAHRLLETFPNARAYCTDGVALSTFLCEYYLRVRGLSERGITVPLDELSELPAGIDVAVNIHSWPECPLSVIEWWLDRLVDLAVPILMVVPNTGKQLLSREADGRYLDFVPALRARGYTSICVEPKYGASVCQSLGIFPTYYHLFKRERASV